jgi:hypothetical protein
VVFEFADFVAELFDFFALCGGNLIFESIEAGFFVFVNAGYRSALRIDGMISRTVL